MNRIIALNVSGGKEKILVWIGAELVHYFLAHGLQKKHDAEYYAIIDITNKPKKFFLEQNFVKFEKIWFYHDEINNSNIKKPDAEFLGEFEKSQNVNLWNLALNERIFYRFFDYHKFSDQEIMKIEENSIKFFQRVMDEVKPDYFLTKQPSFHHLELFRIMCENSNCKVIMMSFPKIAYRMLISKNVTELDYTKKLNEYPVVKKSFQELQDYLNQHSSFVQLENYYKNNNKGIGSQFSALTNFLFSENLNIKSNYNYYGRTKYKVISSLVKDKKKRKMREKFMDKNLLQKIDLNEHFIYFPMSTDLERHLLIDSPYYTNQIEVIRNVAKSIPINYLLYVKENPSNITRDWREISQYEDLLDIPNVRILHPEFSNAELLKNCDLVISIAGSSSFEAAFYEKPSIVFGEVLYSGLPSVTKVKNIEDLSKNIRDSLKEKVHSDDLSRYLELLKENTFEFDMVKFSGLIAKIFYKDETTVDVEINETQIGKFIEDNTNLIDILAVEHVKKIKQHNRFKNNSS
jgi:hypothetical protein